MLGRVILHLPTVGIVFSPAVLPYVVGMAAAALAIVLTLSFRRIEAPEDPGALAAEQHPSPS